MLLTCRGENNFAMVIQMYAAGIKNVHAKGAKKNAKNAKDIFEQAKGAKTPDEYALDGG